jgi:TrmH family RNA methyltransferase
MDSDAWRGVAEECRRLLSAPERARSRRFILEGFRLHERAVRAGAQVESVLVSGSDRTSRMAELKKALSGSGARLVVAPDEVVAELVGGRGTGRLVGIAAMPESRAPEPESGPATFLVAVEVEDPGNVGAMVRTALAAGCAGFIATGISDPYHPKAVRTSMGSVFRIPVSRYDDPAGAIRALKAVNVRCIGAVSRGGTPLHEAGLGGEGDRTALFLGSEARGLPVEVVKMMEDTVSIAMADDVDSFSVNAAAAILLYERFRGQAPKAG